MGLGGRCDETAGFLFPHPCKRMADRVCGRCAKGLCAEHSRIGEESGIVCIGCLAAGSDDDTTEDDDTRSASTSTDDPYFCRGDYYPGYGYGAAHHHGGTSSTTASSTTARDDFTEADGENLTREGDEPFEHDPGAS